ncbi:MAG: hypothetical protein K0S33_934 [Bacteroidetes bacterium]|nr:hypothetical protein [Bacteroidota bacterium]
MKLRLPIFACVLSLGFASCNNEAKYLSQIGSLDSIRVELDKQLAVFQSIDTGKIARYVKTYETNVNWIRENIKDTLPVEYLSALKNYRNINEPLIFVRENYRDMVSDAQLSREQLQKLASDLKSASIEEERAFEFYTVEKNEAKKIMDALAENQQLVKQSVDTFDKYNSEIEKLITLHKNGGTK